VFHCGRKDCGRRRSRSLCLEPWPVPLQRGKLLRMNMLTDKQTTKLLMRLLAIPGLSGSESRVAEFIQRELKKAGASAKILRTDHAHRRSQLGGAQGNLILKLQGTQRAPRRLLVAHMDTVPICEGTCPVLRGQRILSKDDHTGLGADNRAGVAVLLSTALAILRYGLPHPPLTFLWTVQEEVGLHGAHHVQLGLLGRPRLAFNWDGGLAHRLTIGATGGYRMSVAIRGVASHAGGHPEEGVSAIAIAGLATSDLVEHGWHGLIEKGRHRGTSNLGVIVGGAATNVVTDLVSIRAEARSHTPAFRERIVREIEKSFHKAARKVKNTKGQCGQVSIEGHLDYEAFLLPHDDPSLQAASEAVLDEGCTPSRVIANGGLDANWLTARGIPTVSLGCGQNNIHTVDEWLDLPEFHRARRIAQRLARLDGE